MVDDLLIVQKCSTETVKVNAVANAFVEMKRLRFNKDKCHRIHISKKSKLSESCPELKIYDDIMKSSSKEKAT